MAKRQRALTHADYFTVRTFVEKNRESLEGRSAADIARVVSEAVNFPVSDYSIRKLAKELGMEYGRGKSDSHPTNTDQLLAALLYYCILNTDGATIGEDATRIFDALIAGKNPDSDDVEIFMRRFK